MDDHGNELVPAPESSPPKLSEDTVKQLIAQQAREMELRSKELDLRAIEMHTSSAQAEKILGAQERDREAERTHVRKSNRERFCFLSFLVIAIVALLWVGMYLGKDQLIEDVVKVVIGGVGGYGLGRARTRSKELEEEDTSE